MNSFYKIGTEYCTYFLCLTNRSIIFFYFMSLVGMIDRIDNTEEY